MPSKITMHKIENTIAAGATTGTTFSKAIRGKILSIKVLYTNSTPASSSDRDVNLYEMNPSAPTTIAKAMQEILDIGGLGAAPNDDNNVYYPENPLQDYQGNAIDLSDASGGNTAKYGPFLVFGRLMLSVTAAAAGDITTLYLMVEEY